MESTKPMRNSSVELLKIIAMFLIVISHVAQTLGTPHPELSYPTQVFFDSMHSARDIQHFVILLFRHFGAFGNNLFFISSAWFLCGSKKSRTQRIFQILCDVWLLSALSLVVSFAAGIHLPKKEIATILLPSTFEINWYTTFYVCFLAVFPLLNIIVEKIERRNLLKICITFSFIYCGICCFRYLYGTIYSNLTLFCVVYLCVSYCKKYLAEKCDDFAFNLKIFLVSILLLFVLILLTNLLGFKIGFFEHNTLHWARNNNPLIILAAFSLFNLFRQKTFYSKTVNYISSLTLFIYLIHEGEIVRTHFRPWIWFKIHENFGYSHLILETLTFAILLFVAATLLSAFYKATFAKFAKCVSSVIYEKIKRIFIKFSLHY